MLVSVDTKSVSFVVSSMCIFISCTNDEKEESWRRWIEKKTWGFPQLGSRNQNSEVDLHTGMGVIGRENTWY